MSEIAHTQGLWEIVPEDDVFKIITTESDQPICVANKREDADLIACSMLMFRALCTARQSLESNDSKEDQKKLAALLEDVINQANGTYSLNVKIHLSAKRVCVSSGKDTVCTDRDIDQNEGLGKAIFLLIDAVKQDKEDRNE